MSLLQILYTDHKFFKSVTQANPSVDNRLCTTPQKRCEYVLKTYWKLVYKNSITWWYVLKAFWRHLWKTSWRRLQNVSKASWRCLEVLKTSWKRFEDVLKMSWRCFCKTSWRSLEVVLTTPWQDVLKTSWRCLKDVFARRLEDVLKTFRKTSWRRLEDVWPRRIYWSWSRRLHDVFKTNVCWVITIKGNISYLCWSFEKQLASYLKVTGLSCYSYGVCIVCGSATIFELRFGKTG